MSLLLYGRSFLDICDKVLISLLYVFQALALCCSPCCIWLQMNYVEAGHGKSEEVLVLTGLVLECMAYTAFSFSFPLHSCLYWSVGDMPN